LGVLAYQIGKVKSVNLKLIIHEILEDYALPIHGDHGVSHWARVLENGLRLSGKTGANVTVVSLFAVFVSSGQKVAQNSEGLHEDMLLRRLLERSP
jgi:hypothetical protein